MRPWRHLPRHIYSAREWPELFDGLMALALLATVNAMITVGPRVYYAMAGNSAFPAVARQVHPRFHTPVAAIVAQGVCTVLMTLTPFPQLMQYIGITLNFFAAMSVASLFVLRRRPGWQKLSVVSFCYPLFPVLFILVAAWVAYEGIRSEALDRSGRGRHDRHRSTRLPLAHAVPRAASTCGAPGGNLLTPCLR